MYALSHYKAASIVYNNSSFHSSGYSRLESMAHAECELPTIAYSIQSFSPFQSYNKPIDSVAPSLPFNYSGEQMPRRYVANSTAYSPITPLHTEYHFQPSEFLKPGKEGKFIGQAQEIKEYVMDAFEKIFQAPFPNNICISICNEKEFRKIAPHPGTIGLSINRGKEGLISEIFVLNDTLARVMLTLGHELGHVLTHTLANPHDEEAKAYAFSLVWMRAIKEHNIAGLAQAIVTERPAENGLHNVAFGFVERLSRQGAEFYVIYTELIQRTISIAS